MMRTNRRGLWIIVGALVIVVLLTVIIGAVGSALIDDPEPSPTFPPEDQANVLAEPCQFVGATEEIMLYFAPVSDPTQQRELIPGNTPYNVQARREAHYYIDLGGGDGGWVDERSGVLAGDCGTVLTDERPLGEFGSLCLFTSDQEVDVYDDVELGTVGGTLSPDSYVVVGREGDSLQLRLDDDVTGWVEAGAGAITGSCGELPSAGGGTGD